MKGRMHLWTWATLELRFNLPGEIAAPVFLQDYVVALGVDVFCVENEPVHIEETGSDFGKPGGGGALSVMKTLRIGNIIEIYSIVFAIMVAMRCRYL